MIETRRACGTGSGSASGTPVAIVGEAAAGLAAAVVYLAAGAWPYRWEEDNVVVGLFLFPPWWTITDVLMNIYLLVYVAVLAAAAVIAFRGTPGPALEKPAPVRAPEPV